MKTVELSDAILAAGSDHGALLCRNNSGVAKHVKAGKTWFVRYGVGPSDGGGGDFIGCLPVVITPDMVGKTVGVFVSLELKVGDDRQSKEQAKWERWVTRRGGLAGVVRSVSDMLVIFAPWLPK